MAAVWILVKKVI